mmetsp:Transcript_44412/g.141326  ORF Transcript_44412/g.141326 Transcript_44412/m.141326 type:complete len:310 (+) Transcript_44412:1199-2128(+)
MVVFSRDFKNSSNQVTACTSKWLVGSSNKSKSGCTKRDCARAMRMRQPPLNSFVGRRWSSPEKPRPERITAARASASSELSSSRRSYTSMRVTPLTFNSCPLPSSSMWSMACSWRSSHSRSLSARRTVPSTDVSSPTISCSTCIMRMCFGIGTLPSCSAMDRRRVLLPTPFRPMRPYLWPSVSLSVALYSSSCLPANTTISWTSMSMEAPVLLGASGPVLGRNPSKSSPMRSLVLASLPELLTFAFAFLAISSFLPMRKTSPAACTQGSHQNRTRLGPQPMVAETAGDSSTLNCNLRTRTGRAHPGSRQ